MTMTNQLSDASISSLAYAVTQFMEELTVGAGHAWLKRLEEAKQVAQRLSEANGVEEHR